MLTEKGEVISKRSLYDKAKKEGFMKQERDLKLVISVMRNSRSLSLVLDDVRKKRSTLKCDAICLEVMKIKAALPAIKPLSVRFGRVKVSSD